MEKQKNKTERIEIRISSKDRETIKLAQEISGDKTISNFIIRVLRDKADEIIEEKNQILSSERDRKLFFDAIFSQDSKPSSQLLEAVKKYREKNTI